MRAHSDLLLAGTSTPSARHRVSVLSAPKDLWCAVAASDAASPGAATPKLPVTPSKVAAAWHRARCPGVASAETMDGKARREGHDSRRSRGSPGTATAQPRDGARVPRRRAGRDGLELDRPD